MQFSTIEVEKKINFALWSNPKAVDDVSILLKNYWATLSKKFERKTEKDWCFFHDISYFAKKPEDDSLDKVGELGIRWLIHGESSYIATVAKTLEDEEMLSVTFWNNKQL